MTLPIIEAMVAACSCVAFSPYCCASLSFIIVNTVNAQFKLTDKGFIDSKDESKDYIVIDVPDTPQNKLFQKTKMYLNTQYNNPNFVTAEVDNEQIVIDAIDSKAIRVIFDLSGPNIWQFSYKYTFRFRDNRMQFTPLFKSFENTENSKPITLIGVNVLAEMIKEAVRDAMEK